MSQTLPRVVQRLNGQPMFVVVWAGVDCFMGLDNFRLDIRKHKMELFSKMVMDARNDGVARGADRGSKGNRIQVRAGAASDDEQKQERRTHMHPVGDHRLAADRTVTCTLSR